MTVYNRELYIAEAIESVLASTYTNFELIIVDDRSDDRSYEIAKSYSTTDARIRVYQNKQNLGQFPNRNKAAEYAKGKYLKYLDSDDIIYPHGLQVMVWAIEQFPEAGFAISYPNRQPSERFPIFLSPKNAYEEQFLGRGVMDIGPSGTLINNKIFCKAGGFGSDNFVANDTKLLFDMTREAGLVLMPPALIWWRRHNMQDFLKGNASREYLKGIYSMKKQAILHNSSPLPKKDRRRAIKRLEHHEARKILSAISKRKFKEANIRYKFSDLNPIELLKGFQPYNF